MHASILKRTFLFQIITSWILVSFVSTAVIPPRAFAQPLNLPLPGTMVLPTPAFSPVMIKGLKVHPENPLLFDFILDIGKSGLKVDGAAFKDESQKLIKYFLAALTIKEDDLWVNLSPYEKDRILPEELGKTELGRDMLAQDYILKQLTASFMYPEKELGKAFWTRIYAKAREQFGVSDIPVDTFNKVWIMADKARVLERNNAAFVTSAHLKVMLESDYRAAQLAGAAQPPPSAGSNNDTTPAQELSKQIIREVIIPEIEKEVNEGQTFAPLRQMFSSMILATWYKVALKDALLNQVYTDKGKTGGVLSDDPAAKEKIYAQYLEAYKKGVFNYIKEDLDAVSRQAVPRKYFSGGVMIGKDFSQRLSREQYDGSQEAKGDFAKLTLAVTGTHPDAAKTPEFTVEAKEVEKILNWMLAAKVTVDKLDTFNIMHSASEKALQSAIKLRTILSQLEKSIESAKSQKDWENISKTFFGQSSDIKGSVLAMANFYPFLIDIYPGFLAYKLDFGLMNYFYKIDKQVNKIIKGKKPGWKWLIKWKTIKAALLSTDKAQKTEPLSKIDTAMKGAALATFVMSLIEKGFFVADIEAESEDAAVTALKEKLLHWIQEPAWTDKVSIQEENIQETIAELLKWLSIIQIKDNLYRVSDTFDNAATTNVINSLLNDMASLPDPVKKEMNKVVYTYVKEGLGGKRETDFSMLSNNVRKVIALIQKIPRDKLENFVQKNPELFKNKQEEADFWSFTKSIQKLSINEEMTGYTEESFRKSFSKWVEIYKNSHPELFKKEVFQATKEVLNGAMILLFCITVVSVALQFALKSDKRISSDSYLHYLAAGMSLVIFLGSAGAAYLRFFFLKEDVASSKTHDSAQSMDNAANGGIDLNAKNIGLDVDKSGQGIEMRFDPAMATEFRKGNFTGLEGIILKIVPIQNPLLILGFETTPPETQLAQG